MNPNILAFIGQKLQQFKNAVAPPIMSPLAPPPPPNPIQQFQNSRFNLPAQINATAHYFTDPKSFGGDNFSSSPIMQGAANVQKALQIPQVNLGKFMNNGQSFTNLAPQLPQLSQQAANQPVVGGIRQVGRFAANGLLGAGTNVAGNIFDLATDQAKQRVGINLPYNQMKSPVTRLLANINGKNVTPQQVIGNAAGIAEPFANLYAPDAGVNVLKKALGESGIQALKTIIKEGAITGAKQGALQGGTGSLAANRNESLPTQLAQGAIGTTMGAGIGGLAGGAIAGAGGVFKLKPTEAIKGMADFWNTNKPDPISEGPIAKAYINYLRDPQGRFREQGSKTPAKIMTYDEFRTSKGMPNPTKPQYGVAESGFKVPPDVPGTGISADEAAVKMGLPEGPKENLTTVTPDGRTILTDAGKEKMANILYDTKSKTAKDFEADMDKEVASYPSTDSLEHSTPLPKSMLNEIKGTKPPGSPPVPPERLPFDESIPSGGGLSPQQVAEQARRSHFEASQRVLKQTEVMAEKEKNILKTPEDNLNYRHALENPDKVEVYASKAQNPQAFKNLVQEKIAYNKAIYALAQEKGTPLGKVQNYATHVWDLSTPESQQIYDEMMTARAKNFTSKFTKQRVFDTIQEGLDRGLKLKNPDKAYLDTATYGKSIGKQISASALNQKINALQPGGAVNFDEAGRVPSLRGRPFIQSNVPGNQGTFIHPDIQKYMGFYDKSALADNKIVHAADKVNSFIKFWDLGLGGFHALKTTARQVINNPLIIPRAIGNALSPSLKRSFEEKALKDGVFDYGSKIGVTFDKNGDVLDTNASPLKSLNSKSPLEVFNKRLFGGLINTYKINLTRGLMKHYDLNNPLQLKQAQGIAAQINDLMGGLNYEVLNRNKTIQQLTRFAVLAPDFNEGKIRQVAQAGNILNYFKAEHRPAAAFALKNILGEAVVMGTLAMIGQALTTGKFDLSTKNLLTQYVFDPQIPLPNSPTFNNPKNNKTQIVRLPGSNLADTGKLFSDPAHFVQSRGAALPSLGAKIVSGKDYYGRPLVDPNGTQPDNTVNRLKAAAGTQLPIPAVQALKVVQGKETPVDASINVLGGRVANNPNDPVTQQQAAYFNALNAARSSLKPNDQALFDTIHPTKKDYDGNPIVQNTLLSSDKYQALLSNPTVLQAELTFQRSLPNHDPLWDLPDEQRQLILASRDVLPGQTNAFKKIATAQPWYSHFQQAENQFYSNLPQATLTNSNQRPQPSAYAQKQMDLKNWNDPQVQAYFKANDAYNNSLLTKMGLPPIAGSSSSGGGIMGSSQLKFLKKKALRAAKRPPKKLKLAKGKKRMGKIITRKSPKIKLAFKAPKKLKIA